MAYVTVDVEIDLDEFDDDELVDELEHRGYKVNDSNKELEDFHMEDWKLLLEIIDNVPETVYTRRVRDKLMNQRWG